MDIRKLQRVIVDGLEDVKAQNIVVFNTEHLSPLFERVVIASGTSNRQTKSLASSVREAVKAAGDPVPRVEGEANGEWIIVDCGAAVVHVMQPSIREYYHLEELWGEKPVKMKIDGGAPRPFASPSLAPRKAPAEAPAGRSKAPARGSSAAGSAASASKTSPSKTSPSKASAGAKKAPARPSGGAAKAPSKAPARSSAKSMGAMPAKAPARSKSQGAKPGAAARPARPAARPAVTRSAGVKRATGSAGGAAGGSRSSAAPTAARKTAPRKSTTGR